MLKKRVYVALNGDLEERVALELSRSGLAPIRFGRRGDLSRKLVEDPPDALLIEPNADLRTWDPCALSSLQFPSAPALLVLPPSMLPRRGDVLQSGAADVVFRPADPKDLAERVTSLLGIAPPVGSRWLANHPVVLEVMGVDAMGRSVELSRQRALVLLNSPVPLGVVGRLTLTSPLGPPLVVYARTLFCRDARGPVPPDGRARLLVGLRLLALSPAESLALGHLCGAGRSSTPDGRRTPSPLSAAHDEAPRLRVVLGDSRSVVDLRTGRSSDGSMDASTDASESLALALDVSSDSAESMELVDDWDTPLPMPQEREYATRERERSFPRRSASRAAETPTAEALTAESAETSGDRLNFWIERLGETSAEDDWPEPTPVSSSAVVGEGPMRASGADATPG